MSATTATQPSSPANGAIYILPAGKTAAAWGAMANGTHAYWRDGAWEQITPREGWIARTRDSDQALALTGPAWSQAALCTGVGAASTSAANTFTQDQTIVAPLVQLTMRVFPGSASGANFVVMKGRGTSAAPSQTLANDQLGGLLGRSFDASDVEAGNAAYVGMHATENFTSTARRTQITLETTPNGSTTRAQRLVIDQDGVTRPGADNSLNLGSASFRFATVFAGTGTINTSDAGEKTLLQPVPDSVKRAVRRVIADVGVFQWQEAVARKGAHGARLHVGVTAQAVRDAFLAEGEDPARRGLFCADPLMALEESGESDEEGRPALVAAPVFDSNGAPVQRLGVRSDQLMWLAIAAGTVT